MIPGVNPKLRRIIEYELLPITFEMYAGPESDAVLEQMVDVYLEYIKAGDGKEGQREAMALFQRVRVERPELFPPREAA